MQTRIIYTLIFLLAGFSSAMAQDWQERLKEMEARVKARQEAQQARIDLAFSSQMKRLWLEMDLQQGEPLPEIPEPTIPKVYNPDPSMQEEERELAVVAPQPKEAPTDLPAITRKPSAAPAPTPEPVAIPNDIEQQIDMLEKVGEASYFGQPLRLRYDPRMQVSLRGNVSEHKVAEGWEELERTDYELLIYQLTHKAREWGLNDWGFAQLVRQSSQYIQPNDKNGRTLIQWFLLSKSGYIATVGYTGQDLHLMVPSQQTLYGHTYLRGKGQKLYALDLEGEDLDLREARVFSHKYPDASKVMDLRVTEAPRLAERATFRKVSFTYKGQSYRIPIATNSHVVEFYETYPFVDLSIYLGTPASETARRTLVDSLEKAIRNLPVTQGRSKQVEAANFLLHFVQAMPYQTDHEQFGRERYLFADETLYFPASDCEDRSVLYAYLVRELLDLEVVGLLYPGHAATAVYFPENVKGDWVEFQGKRYTVCDPSYIGADLGRTLPQASNQMARVVDFE